MLKASAQTVIAGHSKTATGVGWLIVAGLTGLSGWVMASGSWMSGFTLIPLILFLESWLYLRTPRRRHSWRLFSIALAVSIAATFSSVFVLAGRNGLRPIAWIFEGYVLWLPILAGVFIATLSFLEFVSGRRLPYGD